MKSGHVFLIGLTLLFLIIWCLVFSNLEGALTLTGIILSVVSTVMTWRVIGAVMAIIWRLKNGVDVFATLETDPEKVKSRMLFIMQYGNTKGIEGVLSELNDIFRNYPQWKLSEWEVFRAWYKAQIDDMVKYPEIYGMTMKKDGSPYSKEKDALYDPNAPDWSLYDSTHSYDDSENNDDFYDDEYTDSPSKLKKAAEDGLCIGIGIGAAQGFLNN